MAIPLNQDPLMIQRMEESLVANCRAALAAHETIDSVVYGIFSLDDMEKLQEGELGEKIAVGVGYLGSQPSSAVGGSQYNGEGGLGGKTIDFTFMAMLAVPANDQVPRRYDAGAILSILKFYTMGAAVEDGRTQRPWMFVQEKPEIADSTRTMLYYSQLWRVTIPIVAQPRPNP
ncbi:MAG: hypothetical protein RSE62_03660 [Citrobacter sp.]